MTELVILINLIGAVFSFMVEMSYWIYVAAFGLGILSGLSPTLIRVYTDIISEVARTTRNEMDVAIRSLLFCAGILPAALIAFVILSSTPMFHVLGIVLGFAIALNLFNTGLHVFNSYTRIDKYIKSKFMYLDAFSVLKMGVIHGIGKFSDSVPFFIPAVCLAIVTGSFFQSLFLFILFYAGIVVSFVVLLVLALLRFNIFRWFESQLVTQVYFFAAGGTTMGVSVWLFWVLRDIITVRITFFLVLILIIFSGILIGHNRRIVY